VFEETANLQAYDTLEDFFLGASQPTPDCEDFTANGNYSVISGIIRTP
jgi:hypothetical protein